MTKALTKGAKRRRAKGVGRPRNTEAERDAQGRIPNAGPTTRDRIRLSETPAAHSRLRAMGENPATATQERLREAASDARLVTLAGRLNAAQRRSPKGSGHTPLLSAAAYRGIMQYGIVYERWARSVGSPSRFPAVGSYNDAIKGNDDAEPSDAAERARRATRVFLDAERVVLSYPGAKSAVMWALDAPETVTPQSVPSATVALLEKVGKALALKLWVS